MVLKYFDTAGGTLAVEIEGDGPLIICFPGMGDTRDAYGSLARQLVAQGYCVASADLRGHGDSSTGFKAYGDVATSEDFLTIAKELDKDLAVLAGDSFAGGSATIAAAKSPECVAGIVLTCPFLRNPIRSHRGSCPSCSNGRGARQFGRCTHRLWPGLGDQAKERAKKSTKLLRRPGRWPPFYATVCGCDHRTFTHLIGYTSGMVGLRITLRAKLLVTPTTPREPRRPMQSIQLGWL